jgi:hypothetical protein
MRSESARATAAAESRFRVQAPNATPRRVAVIALDAAGAVLAEELAARSWRGASFLRWSDAAPGLDALLADLEGRTRRLLEVIATADLLVLLTGVQGTGAAAVIGEAAAARRVSVLGVLLADDRAALARLRPHVGMLSVLPDAGDVAAMLEALRA